MGGTGQPSLALGAALYMTCIPPAGDDLDSCGITGFPGGPNLRHLYTAMRLLVDATDSPPLG